MNKLLNLTFKAEATYYDEDQGSDYTRTVEVLALLHSDGQTLIVTDVTPVESLEQWKRNE